MPVVKVYLSEKEYAAAKAYAWASVSSLSNLFKSLLILKARKDKKKDKYGNLIVFD